MIVFILYGGYEYVSSGGGNGYVGCGVVICAIVVYCICVVCIVCCIIAYFTIKLHSTTSSGPSLNEAVLFFLSIINICCSSTFLKLVIYASS